MGVKALPCFTWYVLNLISMVYGTAEYVIYQYYYISISFLQKIFCSEWLHMFVEESLSCSRSSKKKWV
jgi:hypothetical protein